MLTVIFDDGIHEDTNDNGGGRRYRDYKRRFDEPDGTEINTLNNDHGSVAFVLRNAPIPEKLTIYCFIF